MNTFPIDEQLVMLIDRLNNAINVCYTAPENPKEQGYPYATGYARSAMSEVADSLSAIVAQMREEVDEKTKVHVNRPSQL
jgi:hypothetical protein